MSLAIETVKSLPSIFSAQVSTKPIQDPVTATAPIAPSSQATGGGQGHKLTNSTAAIPTSSTALSGVGQGIPVESTKSGGRSATEESFKLIGGIAGCIALVGLCIITILYLLRHRHTLSENEERRVVFDPEEFIAGGDYDAPPGTVPKKSRGPAKELATPVGMSGDTEALERELRELREVVERLKTTIDSRSGAGTAPIDTGVTPPPDYASRRGRTEEFTVQPLRLAIK